jgi:hypothetical protein
MQEGSARRSGREFLSLAAFASPDRHVRPTRWRAEDKLTLTS